MQHLARIEQTHFWFQARRELVLKLFDRFIKHAPKRLLDLGCGTGYMLEILSSRCKSCIGLDLYPKQTEILQVQGNAEQLPFFSAVFDVVILLDLLEHVDEKATLAEVHRVLSPGGVCILTVPAFSFLWSQRDVRAGHLRRYSRKNLETALRVGSLEVLEIQYYQCFLFPLLALSRLLSRILPILCDREEEIAGWMNVVLAWINRKEVALSEYVHLPWGSSLVAVCRKKV
ncbi:MAG TPA: class I SAM-dependent methyltransferase [Chlamydiales bacterium]|nr:class I SAM-dependent methyltransferase [Chlamydiales bacterium]